MKQLEYLSAAEIGREVNAGHISPTEVVRYFEQRIADGNGDLNAFVYTKFEEAEAAARQLEERLARGEDVGPFAGVPFALKDFLPSKKGWIHSHGGVKALIREDPVDSEFTKAMEAAGGIAIGKTNAPAFGFRGTTDNHLYGPTCNPFDHRYNAGGSSGGSAAAVAGGLVPIAEGGDAGGSIRIPAAWCNLFGFKASVGTVPSVCRPDAWSATHPYCFNGGLTKTVEDSAILMSYMAHHDPRDPLSLDHGHRDFAELMNRPIDGWRIAYTPDFGMFPVDPEVAAVVENAAMVLKEAGAIVEPVDIRLPRPLEEYTTIWLRSICVDTAIELELDRRNGFDLVKDPRLLRIQHGPDRDPGFVRRCLRTLRHPAVSDHLLPAAAQRGRRQHAGTGPHQRTARGTSHRVRADLPREFLRASRRLHSGRLLRKRSSDRPADRRQKVQR